MKTANINSLLEVPVQNEKYVRLLAPNAFFITRASSKKRRHLQASREQVFSCVERVEQALFGVIKFNIWTFDKHVLAGSEAKHAECFR